MKTKKIFIFWVILIVCAASLHAQDYFEIRTRSGKTFRLASIRVITSSNVSILHHDGVDTVCFDDLPDNIQRKYRTEVMRLREQEAKNVHKVLDREFKDAPVLEVIRYYADVDQSEPVIASNVRGTFSFKAPASKLWELRDGGYYLDTLRQELFKTRGIIITVLDDRRISVTCNDALDPQRPK